MKKSAFSPGNDKNAKREREMAIRHWNGEAAKYTCARTEQERARNGSLRLCIDIPLFEARKRHSAALIVGNGPSANLISTVELAYSVKQRFDVWSMNQFFPHRHLTPDFHHVEMKGYAERFWHNHFDDSTRQRYSASCTLLWGLHEFDFTEVNPPTCEKKRGQKEVLPSCFSNCPHCLRRVLLHTRLPAYVYDDMAFGDPTNGKFVYSSCDTSAIKGQSTLVKRCDASISTVISMIIRLRYERLYLLGIDMDSQQHFFSPGVSTEYSGIQSSTKWLKDHHPMSARDGNKNSMAARMTLFLPKFLLNNQLPTINLNPDSLIKSSNITTMTLEEAIRSERPTANFSNNTLLVSDETHYPACVLATNPPTVHPAWMSMALAESLRKTTSSQSHEANASNSMAVREVNASKAAAASVQAESLQKTSSSKSREANASNSMTVREVNASTAAAAGAVRLRLRPLSAGAQGSNAKVNGYLKMPPFDPQSKML